MPNPNAIVSSEIRFNPPLDRPAIELLRAKPGLSVELEGKRQVRLDPDDKRSAGFAEVLEVLSKQKLPVYLEIDPKSSTISRLLIPHVKRVVDIRLIDAGVFDVVLEHSHGRHVLRRSFPDFSELEEKLRDAMDKGLLVILTEDDTHQIIDIRPYLGPPELVLPFPRPVPVPLPPWPWRCFLDWCRWPWWPWCWWGWLFNCISSKRAMEVFNAMNGTSCDPLTVPSPCIPFMYPDDGCWGRAHEMCRLMISMGLKPKKVWIQGSLQAATRNNPNCFVWWGWHVAPTLCVRAGFFRTQQMVIDPALFTMPVPKLTWKGVQGDPNATLTDSAASIFYFWGSITDPTYSQTNTVLATYRLYLKNRSINHGPPPYAQCP